MLSSENADKNTAGRAPRSPATPAEPAVVSAQTMNLIRVFRDERNWRQFHAPKDLAISISIEAAELLECFQWSGADTEVSEKFDAMKEELSDVVIYALLLADRLGINMDEAIREKLLVNAEKYPAADCFGGRVKYDELKGRARRKAPDGKHH